MQARVEEQRLSVEALLEQMGRERGDALEQHRMADIEQGRADLVRARTVMNID